MPSKLRLAKNLPISNDISKIISDKIASTTNMIGLLEVQITDGKKEIAELPSDYKKKKGKKNSFGKELFPYDAYVEQLSQNQQNVENNTKSLADMVQMNERLESIRERKGEIDCFVIPADTPRDELKKLIEWSKVQLAVIEDKDVKLFFSALLQTAESCKTALDEGVTFKEQSIPLKASEMALAEFALKQTENYELNKPRTQFIDDCLEKLKKLDDLKNQAMLDTTTTSEDEKKVLQELYNNIIKEVKDALWDSVVPGNDTNEIQSQFKEKVGGYFNGAVAQAGKIADLSSRWKKFANSICNTIGREPYYTVADKVRNNTGSIKETLQKFKTASIAPATQASQQEDPLPPPSGPSR